MSKINHHPILDVPKRDKVIFTFNGKKIEGECGGTIAAALHQAGYPVHSHSLDGRKRSLACGIGKCGACEMLVDGKVKRICVTKVDGVKEVREIASGEMAKIKEPAPEISRKILRTTVVIVGAGQLAWLLERSLKNGELIISLSIITTRSADSLICKRINFSFSKRRNGLEGCGDSISRRLWPERIWMAFT